MHAMSGAASYLALTRLACALGRVEKTVQSVEREEEIGSGRREIERLMVRLTREMDLLRVENELVVKYMKRNFNIETLEKTYRLETDADGEGEERQHCNLM
jgi:hypothetical protein